jgi:hypothetical protein
MQKERAELAGEIAKHLLLPMLYALPGLALVLVVAVGFSLRPLRRLTDDIAARAPDRLTPIDRHRHAARDRAADPSASTRCSPKSIARWRTSAASRPTPRTNCARRWPRSRPRPRSRWPRPTAANAGTRWNRSSSAATAPRHLVTQLLTLARLDAGGGTGHAGTRPAAAGRGRPRRRRRRRHRAGLANSCWATAMRASRATPHCCGRCCATWWTTPCATAGATQIELAITESGKAPR